MGICPGEVLFWWGIVPERSRPSGELSGRAGVLVGIRPGGESS